MKFPLYVNDGQIQQAVKAFHSQSRYECAICKITIPRGTEIRSLRADVSSDDPEEHNIEMFALCKDCIESDNLDKVVNSLNCILGG